MELRVLQNNGKEIVNIARKVGSFDLPLHAPNELKECLVSLKTSGIYSKNISYELKEDSYLLKVRGVQHA